MRIRLTVGAVSLEAELLDTPAARAVSEILPLETSFNTWGDEFYFSVPMQPIPLEADAGTRMEIGDLAYWPEGNALAIFFGPTPASVGEKPVAFSPVNRIGRIRGNATRLREAADAATLRMEPAPDGLSE